MGYRSADNVKDDDEDSRPRRNSSRAKQENKEKGDVVYSDNCIVLERLILYMSIL